MQIFLGSIESPLNTSMISSEHFGTVTKIGETNNAALMVQGSHFDKSMDYLNIGSIRYPGGTEAILDFDISDATDLLGLRRAIDYCAEEGLSLNFTLNDLKYFYLTNGPINLSNNHKLELKNFILNDLLGYAQQRGVTIESFHIGNEFLSKLLTANGVSFLGQSATGYGKNAAALVNYIDELFDQFVPDNIRPDIVVESAGWRGGAARIIAQLKLYGAAEKVDAIDVHCGSNGPDGIPSLNLTWDQYFGTAFSDEPGETYFDRIKTVVDVWKSDPLTKHVAVRMDAWAYPTDSLAGTSLQNAGLGILQMHTFSLMNIISATNYVAYGWDNSALILKMNPSSPNFVADERTTAAGEIFRMMSLALEGKHAIEIEGTAEPLVEAGQSILTRGFSGQGEVILYLISRSASHQDVDLDITKLVSAAEIFVGGMRLASFLVLGVDNQSRANDRREDGVVETIFLTETGSPNEILFGLDGYEIAQISLKGIGLYGTDLGDRMVSDGSVAVHGLDGDDFMRGSILDDTLAGGDGNDSVDGGIGDDLLFGGAGADLLNGGEGNDTVSYAFSSNGVTISLGNSGRNTFDALGDTIVQVENVIGSRFADIIIGNFQSQGLFGGDSPDTITGKGGDDFLDGGPGRDRLYGDSGNDTISGAVGDDLLSGGIGNDLLNGGDGSDLIFGGLGGDTIFGGAGDDTITAGSGGDLISSGSGGDEVFLGLGSDIIVFDQVSDFGDKIYSFSSADRLSFSKELLPFFDNLDTVPTQAVLRSNSAVSGLDVNDYFIFKSNDNTLWYDPDANGHLEALKVCQFDSFSGNWDGVIQII